MPNLIRKNISELLPDEPIKDTFEEEIHFNNTVREYVLFAFILVLLTITSDIIIRRYKRKEITAVGIFYPGIDDGEAVVDRVAIWLCTFSLSVSLGAVLLLPFSILSNEVLTMYQDSHYVRWISLSLVQGLWNMIFLFSNISLFIGLPFAYLFTESEGFPGSSKGLKARIIETVVVLSLLVVLVFGVSFVISFLLGYYKESSIAQIIDMWSRFYLPFLYSIISCLGVLFLLVCTPVGFAHMFTVLGQLVLRPGGFLSDPEAEYQAAVLEEQSLAHHLDRSVQHLPSKKRYNSPFSPQLYAQSFSENGRRRLSLPRNYFSSTDHWVQQRGRFYSPRPPLPNGNAQSYLQNETESDVQSFSPYPLGVSTQNISGNGTTRFVRTYKDLLKDFAESRENRIILDGRRKVGILKRTLAYPLALLLLLALTSAAVVIVGLNTLQLIVGVRRPPTPSTNAALGQAQQGKRMVLLTMLGPMGALLEVLLIFYLILASLLGCYSLPFISTIRPKKHDTPMIHVIGNCVIVLLLSSALPLLVRILGITNFDLLGDYGEIGWLGNFYIVLGYNILFAGASALCLVKKFTLTLRIEIMRRFLMFGELLMKKKFWPSNVMQGGLVDGSNKQE